MQLTLGSGPISDNNFIQDFRPSVNEQLRSQLPENIMKPWGQLIEQHPCLNHSDYLTLLKKSGRNAPFFIDGLRFLARKKLTHINYAEYLLRSGVNALSFSRGLIAITDALEHSQGLYYQMSFIDSLLEVGPFASDLGESLAGIHRTTRLKILDALTWSEFRKLIINNQEHIRSFCLGLTYLHMAKTSWVTREKAVIFADLESQACDYGFFLYSLRKINPDLISETHLELLVQARNSFSAIKQAVEQHDYLGADFFTPMVFSQIIEAGDHAEALILSLKNISSQKCHGQGRPISPAPSFDIPSLTHEHWGCLLSAKSRAVSMSDLLIILEKKNIFSSEISTLLKLQHDEIFPLWQASMQLYTRSRSKITRENFISLIDSGDHAPQLAEALAVMPSELLCTRNRQSLLAAGLHAPIFAFCLTTLLPELGLEQTLGQKRAELLQELHPLLIQAGADAPSFLIGVTELIRCDLIPQKREYFVHLLNAGQESSDVGKLIAQVQRVNPDFLSKYEEQILAHPQKSRLFSQLSEYCLQKNDRMLTEDQFQCLLRNPSTKKPAQPLIFNQQHPPTTLAESNNRYSVMNTGH